MNLRATKPRGEAAHSLPEAIIAALVIGTMLISLYAGFSSGFAIVQSAREELRATQIILERLEAIRLYTWPQLQDSSKYLKPSFVENYDSSGGVVYVGSIITNTPTSIEGAYRMNMLQVTVRVSWTNYAGGQQVVRTRQMQTYVARYGMLNYTP